MRERSAQETTIESWRAFVCRIMILILSLLSLSQRKWPALAIFCIFVLVLWLAFFKQTQSDV